MDDYDVGDVNFNFLSPQENIKLKSFVEYFSEHASRRRIMQLSAKTSEDVVQLFQALLIDNAIECDMDNIINNESKRKELIALLDCLSTELDQSTSNGMHLLIIKLCKKEPELSFIHAIADNPHISSKIIRMVTDITLKGYSDGSHDEFQSRAIAYNANTESQILHELFVIDDLTTRLLIAKHKNVGEVTLALFLNHKSIQVRRLVSQASSSSEAIQIKLLKQNDLKAIEKLSKKPNICDEAVKFLLFSGEVLPTKKRLKTFLTDNPEYYNLNAIKLASLKPHKNIIVPEISEVQLKENHVNKINNY